MSFRIWLRDSTTVEKILMQRHPGEEDFRQWRQKHKRWVIEEQRGRRWVQIGGSSVV